MRHELTLHSGELLSSAKRWSDMSDQERKRRAIEALRDRNLDTLYDLTQSHLLLWGRQGSRVSPQTLRAYKTSIRIFLSKTQDANLYRYRPADAAVYIRSLEASGLAPSTVSVRLAGVRSLYAALRWAGAIGSDPFKDVKPARDLTPAWSKRSPYSDSELAALIAAADPTDKALTLLLGNAGLRIFEAMALKWEQVNFAKAEITVLKGKGQKRRDAPMTRKLADALLSIRPEPATGYILPYRSQEQARARLKRLCKRTNVEYKACHALRHHVGTKVLASGGTLLDAARMLGHSDTTTAEIYAKWNDRGLKRLLEDW